MQLWNSLKYAFRRIFWGKCTWRLEGCLHNNYIWIEFSSYFPFLGSIFLHFLRFLHIFSFRINFAGYSYIGSSFLLGFPIFGSGFPIYWVISFYLLGQVDGVFYKISTLHRVFPFIGSNFPFIRSGFLPSLQFSTFFYSFLCVMSGVRLSAFFYSLGVDVYTTTSQTVVVGNVCLCETLPVRMEALPICTCGLYWHARRGIGRELIDGNAINYVFNS